MKTLKQLFDEHGPGIRVWCTGWRQECWYELIARRGLVFFVVDEQGKISAEYDQCERWKAWEEPEPELVPHWPAIKKSCNPSTPYSTTGNNYPDEESARATYGSEFFRLATEYPPIMLPRKK